MNHRAVGLPLALVASAALLAGCFTSTADFQNDAESFIENDQGLSTELGGIDFVSATCEEPPNRDPDTTFECTGTTSTDEVWGFEIVILDRNEYTVSISCFGDVSDDCGSALATEP
ncbi:MAG: hypothetical protein AAGF73_05875 [Actinomycetota bacterium]